MNWAPCRSAGLLHPQGWSALSASNCRNEAPGCDGWEGQLGKIQHARGSFLQDAWMGKRTRLIGSHA